MTGKLAEDLDLPLQILEDMGYVRMHRRKTNGRSFQIYEVNPTE